jgi:hypothetical protein
MLQLRNALAVDRAHGAFCFALLLIVLLLAGGANAGTITYFLDQTDDLEGWLPDGAHDYVIVTISDGVDAASPDDVDFDVTIGSFLQGIPDPALEFGINNFFFNSTSVLTASNIDLGGISWSSAFDYDPGPPHQTGNGFGRFEIRLSPDTGPDRQDPTLSFSITGIVGDTIADYALLSTNTSETSFFAVQVAGFLDQDLDDPVEGCVDQGQGNFTPECNILNSVWVGGTSTTSVPEPGTLAFLASGLLAGLAVFGRRRQP